MCGIFGYSFSPGTINAFQRGVLAHSLAHLNDKRGGHSWGVVGIKDDKSHEIVKGMGALEPNTAEVLAPFETLFAHTRWATAGAKTIENAHPFEVGHIIGAHNGVLYNHTELNKKYPDRRCDVDSMHLFEHLREGRPFEDIDGYGAIEWLDTRLPGEIFLSRMDGGSLCVFGIGERDNVKGVVWSSDDAHVKEALRTAHIYKAFEYNLSDGGSVFTVTRNQFFSSQMRCDLSPTPMRGGLYGGYWARDDSDDFTEAAWQRWCARNGKDPKTGGDVSTTSGVISTKDGQVEFELVEGSGDSLNPDAPDTVIGKKKAKRLQRLRDRLGEKALSPSMMKRLIDWEERRERRILGHSDSAGVGSSDKGGKVYSAGFRK